MKGSLPVSVSGVRKWLAGACLCPVLAAAAPPVPTACDLPSPLPYCSAVRGDRSEGWHAQSRSEVMAQHGMVATSQPLAAQAGLEILHTGRQRHRCGGRHRGGAQCGRAHDDRRRRRPIRHHLHRQGSQALCAQCQRHGAERRDPRALPEAGLSLPIRRIPGPGSGMPEFGILPVTVPGAAWGWEEVLRRFGTHEFQAGAGAGEALCARWLSGLRAHRQRLAAAGGRQGRATAAMAPDPDSVTHLVHRRQAAGGRHRFPQSRPGQHLRAAAAARARPRSTAARWRAPSWPSRPRWAAP